MKTIYTPAHHINPHQAFIGGFAVVTYLSHDSDCEHPLESCDGAGYIVGRGKYSTRNHDESEMFEALGLDSRGDLDMDADPVLNRARRQYDYWVDNLTAKHFAALNLGDAALPLWEALKNQEVKPDYEVADYVWDAMRDTLGWSNRSAWGEYYELASSLSDWPELGIDWGAAWQEAHDAGEIGDPDAVLLDVYDHGGLEWSVVGRGMQCSWDTSTGAGVWLPDSVAREEIQRRARVYEHAYILKDYKGFTLMDRYGHQLGLSYDWSELFRRAEEIANLCEACGIPGTGQGRRMAAENLATEALETYNAWLEGDCWGVCTEIYGPDGELVEEDACWGFVGSEYAEAEAESEFKAAVARTEKRVDRERADNRFRDAMACGI